MRLSIVYEAACAYIFVQGDRAFLSLFAILAVILQFIIQLVFSDVDITALVVEDVAELSDVLELAIWPNTLLLGMKVIGILVYKVLEDLSSTQFMMHTMLLFTFQHCEDHLHETVRAQTTGKRFVKIFQT